MVFSKIFDKIDLNQDGVVSEDELRQWIERIQRRYISTDTDRQWAEYGVSKGGSLDFSTFMKKTYGYDSGFYIDLLIYFDWLSLL